MRSGLVAVVSLWLGLVNSAFATEPPDGPVRRIADQSLTIATKYGSGDLPFLASRDLHKRQTDVTRAVVVIHGKGRDAFGYFDAVKRAAAASNADAQTIIIAPQFLCEVDIRAHELARNVLRWSSGEWSAGEDALAPATISSFTAVDQILQRLADHDVYPALRQIVLLGHSGGGQFVQRYAIVGHMPKQLAQAGIAMRFVVANPSSYLYFNDERPTQTGTLAPFAGRATCRNFDRWRYGPRNAPSYTGAASFADLELIYWHSDVIYLLGSADTDPNHPELDKTCAGEAQGANRFARGIGYHHYAQAEHADMRTQQFWQVPRVGHDESRMFNSPCGLAAIFDDGRCTTPLP